MKGAPGSGRAAVLLRWAYTLNIVVLNGRFNHVIVPLYSLS